MTLPIAIIGLGGHGRVVLEALRAAGAEVIAATDLNPQKAVANELGIELLKDEELLNRFSPDEVQLVSGIGSIVPCDCHSARSRSIHRFRDVGYRFTGVRHPFVWISPSAKISPTGQVHAGSIIQAGAVVEDFSIVNTRASIDHDCFIEAMCHIGPGAILSGNVIVGEGTHLGTGCQVIQGVKLGKHCFVGAGATVVRDVADGQYVRGTPAKPFVPTSRTTEI